MCDNDADLAHAKSLQERAQRNGNVATVLVGVGSVVVVAGAILYLTAPSDEALQHARLTPVIEHDAIGLAYEGRF